jgi:hypothetical protein
MDHEHVLTAHLDERPDLVLTILESALLVRAEDQIEVSSDTLAIFPRTFGRKQAEPVSHHATLLCCVTSFGVVVKIFFNRLRGLDQDQTGYRSSMAKEIDWWRSAADRRE